MKWLLLSVTGAAVLGLLVAARSPTQEQPAARPEGPAASMSARPLPSAVVPRDRQRLERLLDDIESEITDDATRPLGDGS